MGRIWFALFLPLLVGCADQSAGSALNACRMMYYLDAADARQQLIPNCMQGKSYDWLPDCSLQPDPDEWDSQVREVPYLNSRCYRPAGTPQWLATRLSPM